MANTERELTIKLPESLVEILGGAQKATKEATRATVLDLVRTGKISVGKGAELLNLSRHDFLDLMNDHHVPAIDYSFPKISNMSFVDCAKNILLDCGSKPCRTMTKMSFPLKIQKRI